MAQPVSEAGIPDTDNLCIDVMSIFDQCTGWSPALARQKDEDVILRVLQHIDFVVDLVKPRKQIYIAVDGEMCWTAKNTGLVRYRMGLLFVYGLRNVCSKS